ncbi:MAG: AzlC family ABC transporter permease [Gemmatimonadaceae bacterium]|nr:AzlC family ABC transporter permease [Acetobacteraceae bacterium]
MTPRPNFSRPNFSRAAIIEGVRRSAPIQAAVIPFGLVCGVVSQGQGLSLLEATLMSGIVYAGSAQLLALGNWANPAPVLEAALAAFVVNLRLALMGPVLEPWLDRLRGWRLWSSLFVMTDQNWAMSVTQMQAGRWDAGYLFGSGVLMWVVWVLSTAAGHLLGATMRPPAGHPLFFTALAVFVAMLVVMWRGRRDVMPWAAAAVTALIMSRLLPGTSWYIIGGALTGSAVGVWRDRRSRQ